MFPFHLLEFRPPHVRPADVAGDPRFGLQYAELSHGIRISLVPGIIEAVEAGEIRISTLHNFCPLPIGVNHPAPNIFKFTAEDARNGCPPGNTR